MISTETGKRNEKVVLKRIKPRKYELLLEGICV